MQGHFYITVLKVSRCCTDTYEFWYKALNYSSNVGQMFHTVSQKNSLVYFSLSLLLKDLL